jgi:hypothetical protein
MRFGSGSLRRDARSLRPRGFRCAAAICAAGLLCGHSAAWADEPAPAEIPAEADEPLPAEIPAEADAPPLAEVPAEADAPPPAEIPAEAEVLPESDPMREFDIGFDVVLLRPMGLLQLAVGSAMLIPAYPLSWPSGGQGEVLDILFWSPFEYTIRRPLGEF